MVDRPRAVTILVPVNIQYFYIPHRVERVFVEIDIMEVGIHVEPRGPEMIGP